MEARQARDEVDDLLCRTAELRARSALARAATAEIIAESARLVAQAADLHVAMLRIYRQVWARRRIRAGGGEF
jgi:hypothetical protein